MNNLMMYFNDLMSGVLITIELTLASLIIGFSLAVIMTFILFSQQKGLKVIINSLIFFICGTPLLVQLYLIYYGTGQSLWIRESILWFLFRDPTNCAIIALAINTACYSTVLFKGAINSVPKNEKDACAAMGMSHFLSMRRIIFPRALRLALPAYSNEVIMILKSTSLASTITILELMGVTQSLIAQNYQAVTFYLIAGGIYLTLNGIIILIFKCIQKKYTRFIFKQ